MFYPIIDCITSIIESEAVAGGLLSSLKKVYSGSYQVLPQSSYPASTVVFTGSRISGHPPRLEMEINLSIGVFSIKPSQENSLQELSVLAWDPAEGKGFLPLLIANRSLVVDGTRYQVDVGNISINRGTDSTRRYVWAMEIPLTMRTWAQY